MKKNVSPEACSGGFQFVMPNEASLDEKLLNIYWYKKELEEFLPQIATYASANEVAAITLSQLMIIEKQLIAILQDLASQQKSE